jgi:hypothetical protein
MPASVPQAVQSCHELLFWLIPQIDKFPRVRRFSGRGIQQKAWRVLSMMRGWGRSARGKAYDSLDNTEYRRKERGQVFGLVSGTSKDIALGEMREQARHLGVNAIAGIDIDYETIGADSSMLMVSASRTAVVVEPQ